MEEVKYIPGDLVMTDGAPIGTKEGVVYVVTASNPNRILTLESGEVLKGTATLDNVEGTKITDNGYLFGDCAAWVKHIVPIKLTSKILEDNGWKKEPSENVTWYKYCTDKSYLYMCKDSLQTRLGLFALV